jgi:hypothetical protein
MPMSAVDAKLWLDAGELSLVVAVKVRQDSCRKKQTDSQQGQRGEAIPPLYFVKSNRIGIILCYIGKYEDYKEKSEGDRNQLFIICRNFSTDFCKVPL